VPSASGVSVISTPDAEPECSRPIPSSTLRVSPSIRRTTTGSVDRRLLMLMRTAFSVPSVVTPRIGSWLPTAVDVPSPAGRSRLCKRLIPQRENGWSLAMSGVLSYAFTSKGDPALMMVLFHRSATSCPPAVRP
jgi:hypothetical protein